MSRRRWLRTCLILSLLIPILTPALHGQNPLDTTGRWKVIDLGNRSGFLDDDELPSSVFFQTPDIGYYVGSRTYRTSNGGATWDTTLTSVPVPHTMFTALDGIGSDGRRTTDGGYSWKSPVISFPDPSQRDSVIYGVAGSIDRYAVLYRSMRIDSPYVQRTYRLALTTDGGETWRFLDSTHIISTKILGTEASYEQLNNSMPVGDLPAFGPDTSYYEWYRFVRMDRDRLILMARTMSNVSGAGWISRYFLWTIDVSSGRGSSYEIPPALSNIVALDSLIWYSVDYQPTGDTFNLWWTFDGGTHWQSVPYPTWLDKLTLRFVSPTTGIANNGMTTDGGRTWTRSESTLRIGALYAIDSIHFVAGGYPSTFMRSSNAGRTWWVNDAPFPVDTMLARGAQLLIARADQSMLRSSDSGETLHEVGRGHLPDSLTKIEWMTYPDTTDLGRIVALAMYRTRDGVFLRGLLESRDSGETWQRGQWLNELITPVRGAVFGRFDDQTTVQFVKRNGDGRLIGFLGRDSIWMMSLDSGSTWRRGETIPFAMMSFSMADENHGAAVSVVPYDSAGGIWTTSDGGTSWKLVQAVLPTYNNGGSIYAFDSMTYRARYVDVTQRNADWRMYASNDGGTTWAMTPHRDATFPAGALYWLDTSQVYVFSRGNIHFQIGYPDDFHYQIGYSNNGEHTHGEIVEEKFSSYDGMFGVGFPYSYATHTSRLTRLRLVWAPTATVSVRAEAHRNAGAVRIVPNVASRGGSVRVLAEMTSGSVDLTLLNLIGASVLNTTAQVQNDGSVRLDLPVQIAAGYYLLRIAAGGTSMIAPLIISH